MEKPLWLWIFFILVVIGLLAIDLGIFHKKDREISTRESLGLSAVYFLMALLYGQFIWFYFGSQATFEYLTGFLIEKSLSIDNIFVISLIFTYFAIPKIYQHRVLFWGILGVIILRGLMIGLGAAAIQKFSWVILLFGGFLVITGVKMFLVKAHEEKSLEENLLYKILKSIIPMSPQLHKEKFWVKENGRWCATPLFISLVMVEFADIVFAVDSVPAIFAITLDPYIVYTSNIFAILGLRALYFALSNILHRFEYLKHALALILIFIGGKIFYGEFFEKIPAHISLSVTLALLAGGVIYSLLKTSEEKREL